MPYAYGDMQERGRGVGRGSCTLPSVGHVRKELTENIF